MVQGLWSRVYGSGFVVQGLCDGHAASGWRIHLR
jgi:hypothetical protein